MKKNDQGGISVKPSEGTKRCYGTTSCIVKSPCSLQPLKLVTPNIGILSSHDLAARPLNLHFYFLTVYNTSLAIELLSEKSYEVVTVCCHAL